jgi:small neutral amino acid transporter SnatA (MarC family)
LNNNSNKKREKIITFILGALLIIVVLAIIAIFSGAIMRLLGFEYESVGGFILYFIIASVVSYPINLIAGALPKALLNLDRITGEIAVCMYVLLDTIATFYGFYIVDYFMPSVSANTISLIVLALVFALFGISDIKKKE